MCSQEKADELEVQKGWGLLAGHPRPNRKKGPENIAIRKVKAHTSTEDVDRGVISQGDKNGNDRADQIAKEGVSDFGPAVLITCSELGKRLANYSKAMVAVAKHIVEAYCIHRALLEKAEAKEAQGGNVKDKVP